MPRLIYVEPKKLGRGVVLIDRRISVRDLWDIYGAKLTNTKRCALDLEEVRTVLKVDDYERLKQAIDEVDGGD
ncbi:CUN081 hypothetical protein [Culex nigripalpus nucleopolyhedrovirus]|uniref:Uncharacterized protein n=1 Tax=Culex nigripalpus nucleopolyhedrovirus (isolate Florida/1997) TaxID=645993 RepID=Q919J5_NPVCO|nr:CUN081 hypothetical protein [Culex nigripalpus nucleopolyhedrovirus]AAK94159.1 CUN081 hypothetical protein [Culex nigripalpus nucleopolyhedrovirus]